MLTDPSNNPVMGSHRGTEGWRRVEGKGKEGGEGCEENKGKRGRGRERGGRWTEENKGERRQRRRGGRGK